MHVARLQADDGGAAVARLERRGESRRLDPALLVGRDRLGTAEAEVAQRQVDGVVPLGTDQDAYAGRVDEALGRDLPAVAAQHLVAGGGQAGEVGRRAAGDESDRAARREPEQVDQPRLGELLDRGVGGGEDPQPGVLVPAAHQPVDGERGRVGAADHEAEEPASRHRRQSGLAGGRELVDDRRSVGPANGQLALQTSGHLLGGQAWRHGAVRERGEPLEGQCVGAVEAGAAVVVHPGVHPVSVGPTGPAVEGAGTWPGH